MLLRRLNRPSVLGTDLGLLAIRVWFGFVLAFAHGLGKVQNLEGFVDTVQRREVPLPWLLGPAAALSEFLGGLLMGLGLATRLAALSVLVTMLVAGLFIHAGDPFGKKELALSYAVAALAVLLAGPGRFSVDARWMGRR